jgi:putative ABC transport system ATP-binding protein
MFDVESADGVRPEPMVLSLDDVAKSYGEGPDRVHALRGVSLGVRPGRFVAVMGSPGAGKTTLLGCLAGDITPTSGTVRRSAGERGRAVLADLTDEPGPTDPVTGYVEGGGGRPLGAGRLRKLYKATGLWPHRRAAVGELPAERTRHLAIARALAHDPDLLLVDEAPALGAADDPHELARLLRRVSNAMGTAVVMVTADCAAAAQADAVILLRDGLIVDALAGATPERIGESLATACCA